MHRFFTSYLASSLVLDTIVHFYNLFITAHEAGDSSKEYDQGLEKLIPDTCLYRRIAIERHNTVVK